MNYYEELEISIENHLKQEEYEQALEMIETELSMPYVPVKLLEKLKVYQKECLVALNKEKNYAISFDVISDWLFDVDALKVEAAILALSDLNLRNYVKEILDLLNHHPDSIVVSMILLECIKQNIDTEFVFSKHGLDFKINPVYVEHPMDSDGYQVASEWLQEITFKEPSLNELCQQLLVKEVIVALPLNYEEQEGYYLALSIYKLSLTLLNRESEWYNYTVEHNINEKLCLPLFSTL